jgi:hypothetical protein
VSTIVDGRRVSSFRRLRDDCMELPSRPPMFRVPRSMAVQPWTWWKLALWAPGDFCVDVHGTSIAAVIAA